MAETLLATGIAGIVTSEPVTTDQACQMVKKALHLPDDVEIRGDLVPPKEFTLTPDGHVEGCPQSLFTPPPCQLKPKATSAYLATDKKYGDGWDAIFGRKGYS